MSHRVLIVGNPNPIHIGAHLHQAAQALNLPVTLCDTEHAFEGSWIRKKWAWWLQGHRPAQLALFTSQVVEACRSFKPTCLVATGLAPLTAEALCIIGQSGIIRMNYLTDDPWNPAHRAPWFMETLPYYDHVFSTRRACLADLQQSGCRSVAHLPFAYNPVVHTCISPDPAKVESALASDVIFVGGADRDRVPYILAMIEAGVDIALYGGYWTRHAKTRPYARGHADAQTLCRATAAAKMALCLVRRANRDGHVMRSFEIPAAGTCMLVEDTAEHRDFFGEEKESVVYFRTIAEMIEKTHWLLAHEAERQRLARTAHERVVHGAHTYRDRLVTMLDNVPELFRDHKTGNPL